MNSSHGAIEFLKENPDKISWYWLSHSINPTVNEFLKEHPDKINWNVRRNIHVIPSSRFPHGIQINWDKLSNDISSNTLANLASLPNIFTYNYDMLQQRIARTSAEDFMANRFHPRHMDKWNDWGFGVIY